MLWPLVLPVRITFWVMVALVLTATAVSAWAKRKPVGTFLGALSIAVIAFIPSCAAIMSFLDARRFGVFEYVSFEEVQDARVERYLPPQARAIALEKKPMGHRAMYSLSEADLVGYLDQLWEKYGEYSATARVDLEEGAPVGAKELELRFRGLDWPLPKKAAQYHSPIEHDGGGAVYYVDPTSDTVYHWAGYW